MATAPHRRGLFTEPGSIEHTRPGSFVDAFFFSVQTMATIGYGKLVPRTGSRM